VLVAGVVIRLWALDIVDPIISLVISVWMFRESWRLVARTARILMQGVPEDVDMEAVRAAVLAVDGVAEIHELRVWALSGSDVVLSAHLVVDRSDIRDATGVVTAVKDVLHGRFGVDHATIETECAAGGCSGCVSGQG
jgi:cobalt-zinc-cadmium efflux system protein